MRQHSARTFLAAVVVLAATRVEAQSITPEQVDCFRNADNQVVKATAAGEPAGGSARLYFEWADHGAYYWVDLEHDGPGRYWAIPPKPESRNHEVSYYAVLLDPSGREVTRSAIHKAKVTSDCKVKLNPQQLGEAQNLTIGETAANQAKDRVLGFLCDGIITRVNPENVRRPDKDCRTCIVAWWMRKELLLPVIGAGAVGGITTIVLDHPEPSPSRP
jgi:hypothetical protein